jgi:hypothetical protein
MLAAQEGRAMDAQTGGTIYLVLVLVALVVAVLWVLLPFAVFGMKALLRQAIHEQRRTVDLLHEIRQALRDRKP